MTTKNNTVDWTQVQSKTDKVPAEILDELSQLAKEFLEAEERLKEAEELLKTRKKELERYSLNIIPEAMQAANLEEFKTKSGYRLSVIEDIKCHISKDRKAEAVKWLDDNGHGGLLKTEINAFFTREEKKLAEEYLEKISKEIDISGRFKIDANVHPATLKAFIKRLKQDGEQIDDELFGVYTFKSIKVKKTK